MPGRPRAYTGPATAHRRQQRDVRPCRFQERQREATPPWQEQLQHSAPHSFGSRSLALPARPPGAHGTALVIGAGPAGCAAALALASRGFHVIVAERKSSQTQQDVDAAGGTVDGAHMLSLGERGLSALDRIGAPPLPTGAAVRIRSSVSGIAGGAIRRADLPPSVRMFNISRGALAAHLAAAAVAVKPPGQVSLLWGVAPAALDLKHRAATLVRVAPYGTCAHQQQHWQQPEPLGASAVLLYDLLVGADGSGSAVRAALAEASSAGPRALHVKELHAPDTGLEFKSFRGLPRVLALDALARGAAVCWLDSRGAGMGGGGSGLALSVDDVGGWSGTLYLPRGALLLLLLSKGRCCACDGEQGRRTPDVCIMSGIPIITSHFYDEITSFHMPGRSLRCCCGWLPHMLSCTASQARLQRCQRQHSMQQQCGDCCQVECLTHGLPGWPTN